MTSALVKRAECPEHGPYESKGIKIPFVGRTVWTQCPQCTAEREAKEEAERRAKEERERQQRLEAVLDCAGIPARFRGRTLDTWVAETPEQQRALAVARRFVENWDEHQRQGTSLVFSGRPGTGKSHLAIAIAQALLGRTTVLYAGTLDIIRMIRATWGRDSAKSEAEVLDSLAKVGLLIMDEVGVQYGTEGEKVLLFDVINRRYQDVRPTIYLTNLDAAGLREYLGDRAFDRLREAGIWVPFPWNSYRGRKSAQNAPEAPI